METIKSIAAIVKVLSPYNRFGRWTLLSDVEARISFIANYVKQEV